MTIEEIEELERLEKEGTPRPWELGVGANDNDLVLNPNDKFKAGLLLAMCCNTWLDECKGNPAMLLAVRNALPELLALAREAITLRKRCEIFDEALKNIREGCDCESEVPCHCSNVAAFEALEKAKEIR